MAVEGLKGIFGIPPVKKEQEQTQHRRRQKRRKKTEEKTGESRGRRVDIRI